MDAVKSEERCESPPISSLSSRIGLPLFLGIEAAPNFRLRFLIAALLSQISASQPASRNLPCVGPFSLYPHPGPSSEKIMKEN